MPFWFFSILLCQSSCSIFPPAWRTFSSSDGLFVVLVCCRNICSAFLYLKMSSYQPQFLKDVFCQIWILEWHFLSTSNMSLHWFLVSTVSNDNVSHFSYHYSLPYKGFFLLLSLFRIFTLTLVFYSLTLILLFKDFICFFF